jgi:hypothetical protein
VPAIFDGLVIQYLLDSRGTPRGEELVEALAEWMSVALSQERRRRSVPV